MISISKIMVPLLFPGFLVYVVKFRPVLVTYVKKFTVICTQFSYVWIAKTWWIVIWCMYLWLVDCFWPNFQGFISMKIVLIDEVGIWHGWVSSLNLCTVKLRSVDYSKFNSFSQRSQYISIKFPLHKQSENPKMCY